MTLQEQINEMKDGRTMNQLKDEDIKLYYKVKSLASKLSEEKARENGQFITVDDLKEYKALIIWVLKNKVNYRGYLNLKKAMTILLNSVEKEKVIFKTKKSIKSTIVRMAISAGLEDVENNMREANGIEWNASTMNTPMLADFQQFRLSALMNN